MLREVAKTIPTQVSAVRFAKVSKLIACSRRRSISSNMVSLPADLVELDRRPQPLYSSCFLLNSMQHLFVQAGRNGMLCSMYAGRVSRTSGRDPLRLMTNALPFLVVPEVHFPFESMLTAERYFYAL